MLWDIFCRVIDNYGDIGVCWRLCADLAARGQQVRLWVDDGSALQWMAPGALQGHWPRVQVLSWEQASSSQTWDRLQHAGQLPMAGVWIEAFGCELPDAFVAHQVQQIQTHAQPGAREPVWLNLEYLSAEPYVERSHGLPSPVMQGPAKGWSKTFFYPGFTDKTGGLLRAPSCQAGLAPPDAAARLAFFKHLGLRWQGEPVLSLFCYEPPALLALLEQLAASATASQLLVTAGRATQAVQALLGEQRRLGSLHIHYLPSLSQLDFDQLLDHCDLNFVRGEDSLVRAIWAGQPFVWQIYPQQDQAHAGKLEALMQQLQLDPAVRALHRAWNGLSSAADPSFALPPWRGAAWARWQAELQAARARLLESDDLATRLLQFVQKNR